MFELLFHDLNLDLHICLSDTYDGVMSPEAEKQRQKGFESVVNKCLCNNPGVIVSHKCYFQFESHKKVSRICFTSTSAMERKMSQKKISFA